MQRLPSSSDAAVPTNNVAGAVGGNDFDESMVSRLWIKEGKLKNPATTEQQEEEQNANKNVLHFSDILLGDLLGSGGFSHVYSILDIERRESHYGRKKNKTNSSSSNCSISSSESAMEGCCTLHPSHYAIKFLNERALFNEKIFRIASKDMAVESEILSSLQHEHIIKLHATSPCLQILSDGEKPSSLSSDCFLVLDRLECTLMDQIFMRWPVNEPDLLEKLRAASQISSALTYLHETKRICFRDLKMDNIGFDKQGNIKLFDFGLATRLDSSKRLETTRTKRNKQQQNHDLYQLTGMTGTIPYMAPEVFLRQPYNQFADVYGFVMLLWEMLSMEQVYPDVETSEDYMDIVVTRQRRPPLSSLNSSIYKRAFCATGDDDSDNDIYSSSSRMIRRKNKTDTTMKTLNHILRFGWSADWCLRPTMRRIHALLQYEVLSLESEKYLSIQ